jgi:type IV pilus assembly protein PilC
MQSVAAQIPEHLDSLSKVRLAAAIERARKWNAIKTRIKGVFGNVFQGTADPHAVSVALSQMSFMFQSGVPIGDCLESMARQSIDPLVRQAFEGVAQSVLFHGHSLSLSMSRYPRVFNPAVMLLVRAGEESSDMGERLQRASDMLDRKHQLRCKLKSSLLSPAITTGACMLILFCITKFVLPKFLSLYENMGIDLPLVSKFVIALVNVLNSPIFLLVVAGAIFLVVRFWAPLSQKLFEMAIENRLTRRWVGNWLAVQFVDTIATTMRDGVPLQRSLDLIAATSSFKMYKAHVKEMAVMVQNGEHLSTAVQLVPYFPPVIQSMMLVGEECGQQTQLLFSIRKLLEEQNEIGMTQMTAMVEPLAIAVMGAFMALVCVGMFLPIYGLITQMGGT